MCLCLLVVYLHRADTRTAVLGDVCLCGIRGWFGDIHFWVSVCRHRHTQGGSVFLSLLKTLGCPRPVKAGMVMFPLTDELKKNPCLVTGKRIHPVPPRVGKKLGGIPWLTKIPVEKEWCSEDVLTHLIGVLRYYIYPFCLHPFPPFLHELKASWHFP